MFKSRVLSKYSNICTISITCDDYHIFKLLKKSVMSDDFKETFINHPLYGEIRASIDDVVGYSFADVYKFSHKLIAIEVNKDDVVFEIATVESSLGNQLNNLIEKFSDTIRFAPRCLYNKNEDKLTFVTIDMVGFDMGGGSHNG